MTVYELKLIREKLLELGLIDKIADISSWLAHLKKENIENLLSLTSVEGIDESNKPALLEIDFLDSENYKETVDILRINKDKDIQKLLLETEASIDFLSIPFFGIDSKKVLSTIASAKTYSRAKLAAEAALNEEFFNTTENDLYFTYLNHIINAYNDEIAESLKSIILIPEIKADVKLRNIEKINSVKDERLLKLLCLLAKNIYSDGVDKSVKNIEIISELEGIERGYDFYILLASVASCEESQKSLFHTFDLRLLVKSIKEKEQNVTEALASLALSAKSLQSMYHDSDMELIFEHGTSLNLEALITLAENEISLLSENHIFDMQTIAKVEKDEINAAEKIKCLLTLASLPQAEGHLDEMKLMSITENTDNKLSVLLSAMLDEDLEVSSERTYYLFSIAGAQNYEEAYSIYESFLKQNEEEKQQSNINCTDNTNEQILDAIIAAAEGFSNDDEIPNKVFKKFKPQD